MEELKEFCRTAGFFLELLVVSVLKQDYFMCIQICLKPNRSEDVGVYLAFTWP